MSNEKYAFLLLLSIYTCNLDNLKGWPCFASGDLMNNLAQKKNCPGVGMVHGMLN